VGESGSVRGHPENGPGRLRRVQPLGIRWRFHGTHSAKQRFVAVLAAAYKPRHPTETVLYSAVREHLETFLRHARETYEAPLIIGMSSRARLFSSCMLNVAAPSFASFPRVAPLAMSRRATKRSDEPSAASLRAMPEVRDWSGARRGYWAGKLRPGSARHLEPDLADAFPDDASVNAALRVVLGAAKAVAKKRKSKAA
jgi:hypothetical protein